MEIEVKGESRTSPAPFGGLGARARTLAMSDSAFPVLDERVRSRASTNIELYRDPGFKSKKFNEIFVDESFTF